MDQRSAGGSGMGMREIECIVPLSSMLGYASKLRSMTKGHGQFQMKFEGYVDMGKERQLKIMKEFRGI